MAREKNPDVITLDVIMPLTDGWTVLSTLKSDRELSLIPVILITITSDLDLGFALGAIDYVHKPVDASLLLKKINQARPKDKTGTILVVDDDTNARELMCKIVKKAGWKYEEARNGREAIEYISRNVPAIILLDLMMPEMDGFEVIKTLQANESWRNIPVFVITAKDLTKEEKESLEKSSKMVLQKGANTRKELIAAILDQVKTITEETEETEERESHNMSKILLVEDNELNRDMLSRRLQRKGYEVITAVDGQEGVNLAKSSLPNLILMDMSLPIIDGWEATKQIKAEASTKTIPVIALTAHAMVGDREKSLEAGCDDYDTKPIDFPRLMEKILKYLPDSK